MDIKHYKYVPHHQQKAWEEAGWVFDTDLGPPHAAYASLFRWPYDSEPVMPQNTCITVTKIRLEKKDGE